MALLRPEVTVCSLLSRPKSRMYFPSVDSPALILLKNSGVSMAKIRPISAKHRLRLAKISPKRLKLAKDRLILAQHWLQREVCVSQLRY